MNKVAKKIDPESVHSAISSWSGFVYQGKVALYHVVKLLNKATAGVADYSLQLDSLEDFAIMNNAVPISLHQVKALKSTSYNTYQSAFKKLCKKSADHTKIETFFHTAQRILDKNITEIQDAHKPMEIYHYGTKPNCPLDEIDAVITEQITEYYKNFKPAFDSYENAVKTRHYLDAIVQTKVINIHHKIHLGLHSENALAYREVIPFQKFLEVLNEDTADRITGPSYYLNRTQADLNRYYQEYCFELSEEPLDDCKLKLNNFSVFINTLKADELVTLIRRIIPHRSFALDTITDYKDNNIQQDEIKQSFFKCLMELKEISPLDHKDLSWVINQDKYVPTAINWTQEYSKKACENVIKNILNTDLELPFEITSLITANINVSSIYTAASDIMDVSLEEADREATKITNWKRISMTAISEAKKNII